MSACKDTKICKCKQYCILLLAIALLVEKPYTCKSICTGGNSNAAYPQISSIMSHARVQGPNHINTESILELQAGKRGGLPGALHGPLSEAVIASVSDQAGRQVGSSWDGPSLKRIQQLCNWTDTSQDSSGVNMAPDSSHGAAPADSTMSSNV